LEVGAMPKGIPGKVIDQITCAHCGAVKVFPKGSLFIYPKYCSRSCANRAHVRKGEQNNKWKGGKYKHSDGSSYTRLEDRGYKADYRIAMEKKFGRKLQKDEIVHHIDGNHFNDDLSNLMVVSRREHARIHGCERGGLNVSNDCCR